MGGVATRQAKPLLAALLRHSVSVATSAKAHLCAGAAALSCKRLKEPAAAGEEERDLLGEIALSDAAPRLACQATAVGSDFVVDCQQRLPQSRGLRAMRQFRLR